MLARGVIYFRIAPTDFWNMSMNQYLLCLQEYKKSANIKEIEVKPDEAKEILYKYTSWQYPKNTCLNSKAITAN